MVYSGKSTLALVRVARVLVLRSSQAGARCAPPRSHALLSAPMGALLRYPKP
jgi:hypothetical protein